MTFGSDGKRKWRRPCKALARSFYPAIDAIAGLAEGDAVATAACIAAWTGLCRAGESGACGKAEAALASFESDLVPKAILAAMPLPKHCVCG